jgi:hypothetical protein
MNLPPNYGRRKNKNNFSILDVEKCLEEEK